MADDHALLDLIRAICGDAAADASSRLSANPGLAVAALGRGDECFIAECGTQFYAGDTALHAAATAYDVGVARDLVAAGADLWARNRRGAQPLHSAVRGGPGSAAWKPMRQVAMITYLIDEGADPDAVAAGGVTPLHRAVRNRCSAAVRVLLEAGANPWRPNDKGSTAVALAQWTTGRGGTGTAEAKAEQSIIIELLARHPLE
ncbi:MAG: ankyrin repeat domain-containing protein [Acidimicrobiales bacterium]